LAIWGVAVQRKSLPRRDGHLLASVAFLSLTPGCPPVKKLRTLTPPFLITSKTCRADRRSNPTPNNRPRPHAVGFPRPHPLDRVPSPCGRRGRYNIAKLMEQYGDAKLPACARQLPEGAIVQRL